MFKNCHRLLAAFLVSLSYFPLDSIATTNNHYNKADSLVKIANSLINVNLDSVIYYIDIVVSTESQLEDQNLLADALLVKMKALMLKGSFTEAYETGIEIEKLEFIDHNPIRDVEIMVYGGNMFRLLGMHEEALEYFQNALQKVDRALQNELIADLYYYLALSYYELGDINRSQSYTRRCIKIARDIDFNGGMINGYILYASTVSELDSIDHYYKLADILIANNQGLNLEKVVLKNNQALLNKAIGKLAMSKEQYLEAISISNQYGYIEELGNLYNNYAYQLIDEEKYDSAKISLDLALQAALKVENLDLEASILDSYSDYYKVIDDFENALIYKTNSIKKRREYRELQRIQESLLLSVVFETEEKEKEILLKENKLSRMQVLFLGALILFIVFLFFSIFFQQKSKLRKTRMEGLQKSKSLEVANAIISGQDSERKRLAMDLHDGVGSQLGSLKFQLEGYFENDKNLPKLIANVDDISNNIREISHRMLPVRLEEYGLRQSVEDLIQSIKNSSKIRIELICNLNRRLDEKLEINIYYLLYELINNVAKHAKAMNIVIQLLYHKDSLSISVEDDGIGMDTSKSTEGLGMKNIRNRIKYLDGTFNLESKLNNGTLFMIEIPNPSND